MKFDIEIYSLLNQYSELFVEKITSTNWNPRSTYNITDVKKFMAALQGVTSTYTATSPTSGKYTINLDPAKIANDSNVGPLPKGYQQVDINAQILQAIYNYLYRSHDTQLDFQAVFDILQKARIPIKGKDDIFFLIKNTPPLSQFVDETAAQTTPQTSPTRNSIPTTPIPKTPVVPSRVGSRVKSGLGTGLSDLYGKLSRSAPTIRG